MLGILHLLPTTHTVPIYITPSHQCFKTRCFKTRRKQNLLSCFSPPNERIVSDTVISLSPPAELKSLSSWCHSRCNNSRIRRFVPGMGQRNGNVKDASFAGGFPPGNWDHILSQVGMFSFTGLSTEVCDALREKHHIYMLRNGRISLAGLSTANCAYLTQCIHQELSGEAASEESIQQVNGRCDSLKKEVDYEDSSKVLATFSVVSLPQLAFKA